MKKNSKKSSGKKPPCKPVSKSPFPTDWLYLSPDTVTIQELKTFFQTVPALDVECWPQLGVLELTFPSKRYIDFEETALDLGDQEGNHFLETHQARRLYCVSVEPICTQEEIAVLTAAAQALGGLFAADNENFEPILK